MPAVVAAEADAQSQSPSGATAGVMGSVLLLGVGAVAIAFVVSRKLANRSWIQLPSLDSTTDRSILSEVGVDEDEDDVNDDGDDDAAVDEAELGAARKPTPKFTITDSDSDREDDDDVMLSVTRESHNRLLSAVDETDAEAQDAQNEEEEEKEKPPKAATAEDEA